MKRRRVKVEEIRRAYRAEPFVPFVLRIADGREILVRERMNMMLPPGTRTLCVYDTDDACSFIDVGLVTDLEFRSVAKKARMTIGKIREARAARPFVPFVIHLADGREVPVRSPESMLPSPSGRRIVVFQPDDRMDVVDLLLVAELEFRSRRRRSA
ncbi:MAG: hypothetical protein L0206_25430 [Actinobacteria bacterium]|nr:hypothetical protein [Actinomycetota bacterium]